jgi:RNA polymerase sigma-70 factor (ECF subfamily)
MEQKDAKRPKRRRSKDYPYKLFIRDGKYFVSFPDANNQLIEAELTAEQFQAFDEFELHNKKEQNEWDRHLEHFDHSEPALYRRSENYEASPEEQFIAKLDEAESRAKIHSLMIKHLTQIQRRRIYLHFFRNLTYEEIAKLEGNGVSTVGESVDAALNTLKRHLIQVTMEGKMSKKNTSESVPQEAKRPASLHKLKLKLIRAKNMQKWDHSQAERWMQAVFNELKDNLGIIPSEVPTEAKNAATLEEAIQRYVLFNEYSRAGILRDARAAQIKKIEEE